MKLSNLSACYIYKLRLNCISIRIRWKSRHIANLDGDSGEKSLTRIAWGEISTVPGTKQICEEQNWIGRRNHLDG
jgi:hypothetical protein